jgi:arsenate reductase
MTPAALKRVLFVCIGNSCRSQMAEAFARTYGSDVLVAGSAGLAPARGVARDTVRAMAAKNIEMSAHFPKGLPNMGRGEFDLVVNMTGTNIGKEFGKARMLDWDIADPIGMDYKDHCAVRDEIERRVMGVILELRRGPSPKFRGQGSGRVPL